MLLQPWQIRMFGELTAQQGARLVRRFPTQKTAVLLAFLAYHPQRRHAREELAEQIWPGQEPGASRHSLRQALSVLRRQLEPPGAQGSVLLADRFHLSLQPEALRTDVQEFESLLRAADRTAAPTESLHLLQHAVEIYQGDLLPGHYEDWIVAERERLAETYRSTLRKLAQAWERQADLNQALHFVGKAVAADPLDESAQAHLISLYLATKQPEAALRQYRALERLLAEELQTRPSESLRRLLLTQRRSSTPSLPPPAPSVSAPPPQGAPSLSPEHMPRLPFVFNRFFGREKELSQLLQMLQPYDALSAEKTSVSTRPARLITLTGPGGTGKTRLAIECGRQAVSRYKGAVWFVSLAEVTDPHHLPGALTEALSLPRAAGELLLQVIAFLESQPALLILDNCEQIADRITSLLQSLLQRCPHLTLLATSRRRIGLQGERSLSVPTLPLPAESCTDPEQALLSPGVQMFVDRAQEASPEFAITARNYDAVATLCRRLEGLPLALELAAARIGMLTPAQILERLSERFALLTHRRADKSERHRSLTAAIDWSCQLLPAPLQRLFARLSVFHGGWTVALALALTPEEPPSQNELTSALDTLRLHSLILAEETEGEMRFRMLETLREYGEEKLLPEERAELKQAHARSFLVWAEEVDSGMLGPEQTRRLMLMEREHNNLRAALTWALNNDAVEIGLRLGCALCRFWDIRGCLQEGRDFMADLLDRAERSDVSPAIQARGWIVAGALAATQEDYPAARRCYEQGLALRRALGDRQGIASALNNMGIVAGHTDDLEGAWTLQQESLAIRREMGDAWATANSLNNLSQIAVRRNDASTAQTMLEEALGLFRTLEDLRGVAFVLHNLGELWRTQEDYAQARIYHRECLRIRHTLEDKVRLLASLDHLGYLAARLEELLPAIRLFAAADALRVRLQFPEASKLEIVTPHLLEHLRAAVGEEAYRHAWAQGQALTLEQAIAEAMTTPAESASRF